MQRQGLTTRRANTILVLVLSILFVVLAILAVESLTRRRTIGVQGFAYTIVGSHCLVIVHMGGQPLLQPFLVHSRRFQSFAFLLLLLLLVLVFLLLCIRHSQWLLRLETFCTSLGKQVIPTAVRHFAVPHANPFLLPRGT